MRTFAPILRFVPRLIAAALLVTMTSGLKPATKAGVASTEIARRYPELRLRKMHMVRPDLIPYPVYFDIYC